MNLPDWLAPSAGLDAPLTWEVLAARLVAALLLGGCVALIYRLSHGRQKHDSQTLVTTLVLLSVLIAMVSMVIGNSVARAFSLVGALSIVRFRTVVDDTRDTAFVIFAVIVGMSAGAGLLMVSLVGIPIVGGAALVLSRLDTAGTDDGECSLEVRLALGRDPDLAITPILNRHALRHRLTATATVKQGSAIDLRYTVKLRSEASMIAFASELHRTEGVQSVELKKSATS